MINMVAKARTGSGSAYHTQGVGRAMEALDLASVNSELMTEIFNIEFSFTVLFTSLKH